MIIPRSLGYSAITERDVFLLRLDSLEAPYARPATGGHHFACFCVIDASKVSAPQLGGFCSNLLRLGCAYLCAWGPDCKRLHDIMDSEAVGSDPPRTDLGCVMTTWHANESLPDALDFFLSSAYPDESFAPDGCDFAVIITVGSGESAEAIEKYIMPQLEGS
jgi:hypothetical protein